jgi:hypothetical protein
MSIDWKSVLKKVLAYIQGLFMVAVALTIFGCATWRSQYAKSLTANVSVQAVPAASCSETNGALYSVMADVSNGTLRVSGGTTVIIAQNVQFSYGGGTLTSNNFQGTLEIPATAAVANPNAKKQSAPWAAGYKPDYGTNASGSTNALRLLVIGDSWASAKRSDSGRDNGWPEMLGIPDEYRQGVDGSTAVQWDADQNGMLTRALGTPCEKVVISLGGNDAFALGENKRAAQQIDAARAALNRVVARFQDKVGATNVWVLIYANPWPDNPSSAVETEALKLIMIGSCPNGTQFWDTGKVLNTAECFSNNDYHPNLEGSVRLSNDVQSLTGYTPVVLRK